MIKVFLLIIFVLFFLFSCSSDNENSNKNSGTVGSSVSSASKPNILLIIADDMGLDATPGYSQGTIKPVMPTIENFAKNGIRFNNLWSDPTCTPTRATILTGKYGFRTNMIKVGDILSSSETSLQKYLKENNTGYSTALIGKWHLSEGATDPVDMGIDYYAGLLTGTPSSYTNWKFTENGHTVNSTDYITSKFSDLAIDWLHNQSGPWFLWLAYTAPHPPFHLPPGHLHTQTGLIPDQANIDNDPQPYYMAMLEAMDTEIKRVLDSLSPEDAENTLIIFIGDNGTPGAVAQDYNTQRVKGTVYQGGINVPMIVTGKGVSRINQSEDALINTTDLFATIADIADIDIGDNLDSNSFKGLLTDETTVSRDYVYSEIGKNSGSASDYTIRDATHKYIRFGDGTEALYNLSKNPLEFPNLLSINQLPLNSADSKAKDGLVSKLTEIRQ